MENLKMHTPNLADENFKKLAALFPNAVTETINDDGEVVRAIDADVLRQEISAQVVEGMQERYQFTWPDKKKSVVLANQPIAKTLRLERDKSVGRDGTSGSIDTENIYIEGDNLDALKLLQETYLGKVKLIYIDPPYNTGSDFVYEDDYSQNTGEYLDNSGQFDDQGNRLVKNLETNGRFHTDWLNMIYPRIRIAKDLLTDDGVIFISIDDNEQQNLKKICDEIFGEDNILSILIWNKQHSQQQGIFKKYHEYVLVYCKSKDNFANINGGEGTIEAGALKKISKANPISNFEFPAGTRFDAPDGTEFSGTYGKEETVTVIKGRMIAQQGKLAENVILAAGWTQRNQMISYFSGEETIDSKGQLVTEFFFNSSGKLKCTKQRSAITPPSILPEYGTVSEQTKQLNTLMGGNYFDMPKPVNMIKDFINWFCANNDIVLDFFSGSATTAHAVMQLNAEDGGHRKFIMVQLPEPCPKDKEAYKAGYATIAEIGRERIRRAGQRILSEISQKSQSNEGLLIEREREQTHSVRGLDVGFRVFRVDSSNMNDVYYRPKDLRQEELIKCTDNIKEGRAQEDLLFQVMLDLGVLLSSKIEETVIADKKVFSVADGYLIACFDSEITDETVKAIAQKKPSYAVFRDSGMANDSVLTNFEQIFETYSPKTKRMVL